ncbi:MAG TPA: hypothetical protein VD706_00420 [Candidatus Saccharimonadales bacterium]|nr:hypothetical protein [Candidatus Saccharimonadales bacterium]
MLGLVSTRDLGAERIGYADALLDGLAPDGGLYLPEGAVYPHLTTAEITRLGGQPYAEVATTIKSRLIDGDIDLEDQCILNDAAYDPEAFPQARNGNIAPVEEVAENVFLMDLSLGPTAAFKDFGLRSVAWDVVHLLDRLDERQTKGEDQANFGASSGDTFSASMRAFKDAVRDHFSRTGRLRKVLNFMMTPLAGTMTTFQRAQGGLEADEYNHNLSFDGSFDDCQDMVKAIKQEEEFSDLGAVNSINWGRIVGQVVYYFYAYAQMEKTGSVRAGQPIDVIVPTGNFGNVLSAHIARRMGLPIENLTIATNENNVLDRLVRTGEYERSVKVDTSSPSMDITTASNYERLVYEFFEGDAKQTRQYMEEFGRTGKVSLEDYGLDKSVFSRFGISSGSSTHADRIESIREIYRSSGKVIGPHAADSITIALRRDNLERPTLCVATDHPVKSEATVEHALGFVLPREPRFEGLENRPGADNFVVVTSIDGVKNYLRKHRR